MELRARFVVVVTKLVPDSPYRRLIAEYLSFQTAVLPNLKNSEDMFRRISVTDDHTIEERQEIRRLVDESKEKNRNETNAVWKVRGDKKKSWRLVKFTKRAPPSRE